MDKNFDLARDLYIGLKDNLLEDEILEVVRKFLSNQNVSLEEIDNIIDKLFKNNLTPKNNVISVPTVITESNNSPEKDENSNTRAIVKFQKSPNSKISLLDKIRILYYHPGFAYKLLKLNIYEWVHFPKYKFRFFVEKILNKFRNII